MSIKKSALWFNKFKQYDWKFLNLPIFWANIDMRTYFVKYLAQNILLISQIDVFTKPVVEKAGKASQKKNRITAQTG
jgi:hypothetical protein